jgi:hypothetical protein
LASHLRLTPPTAPGGLRPEPSSRSIEDYDTTTSPVLLARRTYGSGLDDIVYLESDLDGSGNVAAKSWPLYEARGQAAEESRQGNAQPCDQQPQFACRSASSYRCKTSSIWCFLT